jgi:hypothetical protein
MDLPKELRLMVYECLLTHSRPEIVFRDDPSTTKHSRLTIVLRDAIPPIHHTCRELHIEVLSTLKPKIDKLPPIPHIFAEVSDSRMSSLFLGIEQILRIIALSRERDCQTTEEIQHLFEEDTYPQPWYCAIDIRAAIDIQAVARFIKMAARRIAVDTGPSDSTTEIAHLLHIAMDGTKNNALRWIWFHEIMMMACEIHMVPCAWYSKDAARVRQAIDEMDARFLDETDARFLQYGGIMETSDEYGACVRSEQISSVDQTCNRGCVGGVRSDTGSDPIPQ